MLFKLYMYKTTLTSLELRLKYGFHSKSGYDITNSRWTISLIFKAKHLAWWQASLFFRKTIRAPMFLKFFPLSFLLSLFLFSSVFLLYSHYSYYTNCIPENMVCLSWRFVPSPHSELVKFQKKKKKKQKAMQ